MKLCKDCKYSQRPQGPRQPFWCERTHISTVDAVTGMPKRTEFKTCVEERRSNGWFFKKCGPDGRYFERGDTK